MVADLNALGGIEQHQDLSGVCILTLDDDTSMRWIVRNMLEQFGCRSILQTGDGAAALRMFATDPIDMVICDWFMEPMDGLNFLRELRATKAGARVPVVMLTANSRPGDTLKAQPLNISGWLIKPISAQRLIERVSTVLSVPEQSFSLEKDLGIDFDMIAKQYRLRLGRELVDLQKMVRGVAHQSRNANRTWGSIVRIFHSVKGQAGTFGYDLITSLAVLGQSRLRPLEQDFQASVELQTEVSGALTAIVGAMILVLQNDIRGDGGAVGRKLLAKLAAVIEPGRLAQEAALREGTIR